MSESLTLDVTTLPRPTSPTVYVITVPKDVVTVTMQENVVAAWRQAWLQAGLDLPAEILAQVEERLMATLEETWRQAGAATLEQFQENVAATLRDVWKLVKVDLPPALLVLPRTMTLAAQSVSGDALPVVVQIPATAAPVQP